ncbi:unnamed protein product [Ixodes pacificus]
MDDAVASLAVPFNWDFLHSWKHARRLIANRTTAPAGPWQPPQGPLQTNGRVLIVYDRRLCTREEDDPNDAIVYFHPSQMPVDQRCDLCCQLVGMVHFFDSCFDTPELVALSDMRFAIRLLGDYIVILGEKGTLDAYVVQQQMDTLVHLLQFYHRSFADIKQRCSNNREWFVEKVREFCNSSLHVCCKLEDRVSNIFQAVPELQLPEGASAVYARGYALLEEFQTRAGVLAGCIMFEEKVLASQMTPEVTRLLQLAAHSKDRLAMEDVHVRYHLPPGVRIVCVYLTPERLKDLASINKHSNQEPKELDKYADLTSEEASCPNKSDVPEGPEQAMDPPDDFRHPIRDDKNDSLSDVDSSLSSQTTTKSNGGVPFTTNVPSTTEKQSLPDSDFLSDFDSAEDMRVKDACMERLRDLQKTVEDCLRISQENLAHTILQRKATHRRHSKVSLRRQATMSNLYESCKVSNSTHKNREKSASCAGRYDDDIAQSYGACMGYGSAGLLYQAENLQTPELFRHEKNPRVIQPNTHPPGNCTEVVMFEQGNNILWDLYTDKVEKALAKLKNLRSVFSGIKKKSLREDGGSFSMIKETLLRAKCEASMEHPLVTSCFETPLMTDLPPVVQVDLVEPLEVGEHERGSRVARGDVTATRQGPCARENGTQQQPLSLESCEPRDKNENEHTSSTGRCRGDRTDEGELCRVTLFIQRHCGMVCMVLLAQGFEEDESLVQSLWKRGIGVMGDLEVAAKSWQLQPRQLEAADAEGPLRLVYHSKLHTFTDSPLRRWNTNCSRMSTVQVLHGEFLNDGAIKEVFLMYNGEGIHSTRTEDQENYRVVAGKIEPVMSLATLSNQLSSRLFLGKS